MNSFKTLNPFNIDAFISSSSLVHGHPSDDESLAAPWYPPVNIRETESAYLLIAQTPGLREGDIDLSVENGILTVRGNCPAEENGESETVYRVREFGGGEFLRQFRLGESIDSEKIQARLEHGLLRVTLPKREEIKARKITIQSGS